MNFLGLHFLWLLFLLVPLIAFYFLKLRRQRVALPSLLLWRQVLEDSRVNSPFQRFKRNLLLLLQILLLLLVILALLQPTWRGPSGSADRLPVIVDISASMAADDGGTGPTRLDLARRAVEEWIENLGSEGEISLVAMGATARRLCSFTSNPRILREALDRLEVEDAPADLAGAVELCNAMARSHPIDRTMIISDGNLEAEVDADLAYQVEYRLLPPAGPNVGIIGLAGRRLPGGRWEILIGLVVADVDAADGRLVVESDGVRIHEESYQIPAGGDQQVLLRVAGTRPQRIDVRLEPRGRDSLTTDDRASLALPAIRPVVIAVDPELASWRRALAGIDEVEVVPPGRGADAAIVRDPAAIAGAGLGVVVDRIPEDLAGILTPASETQEVADWKHFDPLLRYVQLEEVLFSEGTSWDAAEDRIALANRGWEVVIHGRSGPLMVRRESEDALRYHLLAPISSSTLPYQVSFPIMVQNLVRHANRFAGMEEVHGGETGVLSLPPAEPGSEVRVTGPGGTTLAVQADDEGRLPVVPAPRAGVWEFAGGVEGSVRLALLDERESRLRRVEELQLDEIPVSAADAAVPGDRQLWRWVALTAFLVLLGEWWYFSRAPKVAVA